MEYVTTRMNNSGAYKLYEATWLGHGLPRMVGTSTIGLS